MELNGATGHVIIASAAHCSARHGCSVIRNACVTAAHAGITFIDHSDQGKFPVRLSASSAVPPATANCLTMLSMSIAVLLLAVLLLIVPSRMYTLLLHRRSSRI